MDPRFSPPGAQGQETYANLASLTVQVANGVHLRRARLQLASVFAECAAGPRVFEEEG